MINGYEPPNHHEMQDYWWSIYNERVQSGEDHYDAHKAADNATEEKFG